VTKARIESLQVLRFLAASMVAWLHIMQAGRTLDGLPLQGGVMSNIGSFGVDVFFVISGFIIARTSGGKSPAEFLRLRLTRVVPMYWIMTAIYLPFIVHEGRFGWTGLIASVAFYPGLGLPYLKVGWTLCFEMLFYIATAWTLYRPRVFAPLAVAAFALCWALRKLVGGPFEFFGNPLILEFLAGVLIARWGYRSKVAGVAAAGLAVVILVIVAIYGIGPANGVYYLLRGEFALERVMVMGVPAAALVFAALQWEMKPTPVAQLGDASYALYLAHPVLISATTLLFPSIAGAVFTPLVFVASVLVSLVLHRWLERPLIAACRRPPLVLATA
jgi:exopolysaccharide production protein ExoZ